jgi:predicted nucleic acid-binding protein
MRYLLDTNTVSYYLRRASPTRNCALGKQAWRLKTDAEL